MFACAFGVHASVCSHFPFMHLIVGVNEMKAVFGCALCLNVILDFLCQGGVRSRPRASVSHLFSPEGNSLSSSSKPSIYCCPFVSDSIHRS